MLQRAARCHAARARARDRLAPRPAPSPRRDAPPSSIATRLLSAAAIRSVVGARFSVRQACAVQCQALVRGALVRSRLRKWRAARGKGARVPGAAAAVVPQPSGWAPRAPESLRAEVQALRAALAEERAARRRQDEALRLLWGEVAALDARRRRGAALAIQRCWRGHDDRALVGLARAQLAAFTAARERATRVLQRAARRRWGAAFGLRFRARTWAASMLQRGARGALVRRARGDALRIALLEAQVRWMSVETRKLYRSYWKKDLEV